jgi:glycerol-3-phosphate dehydrogenase (NAD(P)+)
MADAFGVIGDGGMGTLCALLLADAGGRVVLWSAFEQNAAAIRRDGQNRRYLPGVPLPEAVTVTCDAADIPRDAAFVVSAVPTAFLREVTARVAPHLPDAPVVSVTKGIEQGSLRRPSEVLAGVLGPGRDVAVLSGPCIAYEVARRLPATVVVSGSAPLVERVQRAMTRPFFRVYGNRDPLGVELGGALKNVIALAAGICDGLGLGVNAKAALLTRGLAEITRLGVAMGARAETFAGLAGCGDLFTTCVSEQGRNRTAGESIGRGRSLQETLDAMGGKVAEGVGTARSAAALAERVGVEMPITAEVCRVLFEGKRPRDGLADLMARPYRTEEET